MDTNLCAIIPLAASALLLIFGIWDQGNEYSFLTHTISDSTAQGIHYGWVSRLGLLLLSGVSVAYWWIFVITDGSQAKRCF